MTREELAAAHRRCWALVRKWRKTWGLLGASRELAAALKPRKSSKDDIAAMRLEQHKPVGNKLPVIGVPLESLKPRKKKGRNE